MGDLTIGARYENYEATDEEVAYLNDIAASPGSARPKANVIAREASEAITTATSGSARPER